MSQIKNPYSEMLNLMASQGAKVNTPGISFGVIKSVEPLVVETGGIELDSNFVSLIGRLKPYKANCELNGQFDINTLWTPEIDYSSVGDHGSHNHTSSSLTKVSGKGTFTGTIYMKDYGVKAGDKVILLCTDDKQQYFVIDKV